MGKAFELSNPKRSMRGKPQKPFQGGYQDTTQVEGLGTGVYDVLKRRATRDRGYTGLRRGF